METKLRLEGNYPGRTPPPPLNSIGYISSDFIGNLANWVPLHRSRKASQLPGKFNRFIFTFLFCVLALPLSNLSNPNIQNSSYDIPEHRRRQQNNTKNVKNQLNLSSKITLHYSHVMYVSLMAPKIWLINTKKKKKSWGSDFLLTCADPRDVLAVPSSLHRDSLCISAKISQMAK